MYTTVVEMENKSMAASHHAASHQRHHPQLQSASEEVQVVEEASRVEEVEVVKEGAAMQ